MRTKSRETSETYIRSVLKYDYATKMSRPTNSITKDGEMTFTFHSQHNHGIPVTFTI